MCIRDRLTDLLIYLIDWLIDWLIDFGWLLFDRLIDWLGWLINRLIDWLLGWLIDWCWIISKGCDRDGTRSREVDSRRRYTDLLLYSRPSSDSACKGTKHTLALTSVKLPAEESPYNNSSAKTWNSLIYNGSYPSNYRTQQTSPLVGTCYIRPYRYPPFSVHDKARRSGMIPCNYNVQISKIDFKSARKNPNPSTKNHVL